MGLYTRHDLPSVDSTVGGHMDVLAGICRSTLGSNLDSVVLAGSFGRGEGSVLIGADGTVQPVRDYDVRVILREPTHSSAVEKIRREFMLATGLGRADERFSGERGFSITVEPLTRAELSGPFVRDRDLRAYDHLTASRVIWGRDHSPELRFEATEIPKVNGLRFLYQKMVGLVGHYRGPHTSHTADEARRTLIYECDKTFIEICTALCLLADTYVPSYEARAELFARDWQTWFPGPAKDLPGLGLQVLRATREKLCPGSTVPMPVEFAFYKAREALLVTHRYYVRRLYGVDVTPGEAGCKRLLKVLRTHYYRGPVSNRLEEKGLNNRVSVWALNEVYGRALRLKYAGSGLAAPAAILRGGAPNIDIFVASWCTLASLSAAGAGEPDGELLNGASHVLGRLPGPEWRGGAGRARGWKQYRVVRAHLTQAYRRWEQS